MLGVRLGIAAVISLGAIVATPSPAHAFCGFYIDPGGSEMINNATQVVLMRKGTRTVLSMQNNYQGPPTEFAMVVPVPVVLRESDVKTLPKEIFAKVEAMSAPRLVEYWEKDPCWEPKPRRRISDEDGEGRVKKMAKGSSDEDDEDDTRRKYKVTIEAKFDVGEYHIAILSAKESTGLAHYLRDQHYRIPASAEPLLRPYVDGGSKFFVAKVDPRKVQFVNGSAMLSPLRFHYDSEEFSLPIRLGLANARAKQDLIVHIIAPGVRYEVANYRNVAIPTNFDVKDEVRTRFGEFYASLFDRTLQQHPGAIVTEYAWDATTCDPCPGPRLTYTDFATLGADVIGDAESHLERGRDGFVLTRLHARYSKHGAPNDLVFRTTSPIAGGRERRTNGVLEHGVEPSSYNNFQGRYTIRHEWDGPILCENPIRGRWVGPKGRKRVNPIAATNLAFAPRGALELPMLVLDDVPEIDLSPGVPFPPSPPEVVPPDPTSPMPQGAGFHAHTRAQGCGCATGSPSGIAGIVLALLLVLRRRR